MMSAGSGRSSRTDRKSAATVVVAAIVLAAALGVLVRTWTAGVFSDGTSWELRGVLGCTRIRRSSITAIGLTDEWGLFGPIRMLRIDQRMEDPVTYSFVAWGNQLNSFRSGGGISNDESPRQARTLDALRVAAQLSSGDVRQATD